MATTKIKIDDGINVSIVTESKIQQITGNHGLKNNDMIYFKPLKQGWPKGIAEKQQYYVRNVTTDGFSISTEDKGDVLKNLGKGGNLLMYKGKNPLVK